MKGNLRLKLPVILLVLACCGFLSAYSATADEKLSVRQVHELLRPIEHKAIAIVKSHFGDSPELRDFIERYEASDEAYLKTANFNALGNYFDLVFAPEVKSPTDDQRIAIKEFLGLAGKHLELQAKHELPLFANE